jgi:hypothetical protein
MQDSSYTPTNTNQDPMHGPGGAGHDPGDEH